MSSVDYLPTIASLTQTSLSQETQKNLVGMDMTTVLKGKHMLYQCRIPTHCHGWLWSLHVWLMTRVSRSICMSTRVQIHLCNNIAISHIFLRAWYTACLEVPISINLLLGCCSGGDASARSITLKWDWRFGVIGNCWNEAPRLAIRKGDWKLLMNADSSRVELYNMTEVSKTTYNFLGLRNRVTEGHNYKTRTVRKSQWHWNINSTCLRKATILGQMTFLIWFQFSRYCRTDNSSD